MLSILPEPKNLTTKTTSKSLIPHSVAKQQKKPTPGSAQQSTKKPVKVTESPSKLSVHNDGSDEEEDVRNEPIDFFSLTDVEQPSLTDGLSNSLDPSVSVSDSDAAVGSYQSSDMASYQNESLVSLSSSSGLSNYATMTVDNTLIQNYQASSYSSQQVDEGVQSYSNGNDEDPLLKDEGVSTLNFSEVITKH